MVVVRLIEGVEAFKLQLSERRKNSRADVTEPPTWTAQTSQPSCLYNTPELYQASLRVFTRNLL